MSNVSVKPKYGGPGKKKKCCIKRKCRQLTTPSISTCDVPTSNSVSTNPPDVTELIKTLRNHKLGTLLSHTQNNSFLHKMV